MLYPRPDKWLNDPRLLYQQGAYHLLHLQGARESPGTTDQEMAHAVSDDLLSWNASALILEPGEAGEWDDRAVCTGGCIYHDDRYRTLYTGLNEVEEGAIQRIGLAWSPDLTHWERHPNNPACVEGTLNRKVPGVTRSACEVRALDENGYHVLGAISLKPLKA